VWVCVCVNFVICGCFDNCVGALVICVLVFTVFCIVCTVFLYCFVCVYLFLFVLSLLMQGLLPPSENSIAIIIIIIIINILTYSDTCNKQIVSSLLTLHFYS